MLFLNDNNTVDNNKKRGKLQEEVDLAIALLLRKICCSAALSGRFIAPSLLYNTSNNFKMPTT